MGEQWSVSLYRNPQGKLPVKVFIDSLELKVQSKIQSAISLLKEFGLTTGLPHSKKLQGTDLWELRILGGDNIRIFYAILTDRTFILLHGFKKKTDKTPRKEIKIALERLMERKSRLS